MSEKEAAPTMTSEENPHATRHAGDVGVTLWCAAQATAATRGVARLRKLAHCEEGVTTAEYVVVLLAAVGFATVLMGILKSDTVKQTLTNIVTKALSVV